jgi:prevent-host-death family protein
MTITVNVHDAKTRFSQLLDQAHAGQEIILAKAGKPYARMVPLAVVPSKRQPGRLVGLVNPIGDDFFDALPEDELAAWEGS